MLIFTAGVLALLSPCGYPMLPGYVSYYLGADVSVGKAVPSGVACTLGLISVFTAIGAAASFLGVLISSYLPFLELAAGIVVIFLGISILAGFRLPAFWAKITAPRRRGLIGIFLYGAAYGLATLGCSAPVFFSILFYAVAARGLIGGMVAFIVYAIGMGLPLVLTTILVAKAKELTLRKMLSAMPMLQRLSGVVLVLIGIYLIFFYYGSLSVVL